MFKYAYLFLLILIIPLISVSCSDDDETEGTALSENTLFDDPDLTANPEIDVVIKLLEPKGPDQAARDTGETGFDKFTYKYEQSLNHTFCWEDDDEESAHFLTITDSGGEEILRVQANGECITAFIPEGTFEVKLFHDNKTETTYPVFITPEQDQQAGEQARINSPAFENLNRYLKFVLENFDLSGNSYAQDNFTCNRSNFQNCNNIMQLISTNKCSGCIIKGADFKDWDLTNADLSQSTLSNSDFTGATLVDANFEKTKCVNCTLTNANFRGAIMGGVNLGNSAATGANFFSANMNFCSSSNVDFTQATFNGTDIAGCNFSNSDFTGASISDVFFGTSTFVGATWTNGIACESGQSGCCNQNGECLQGNNPDPG